MTQYSECLDALEDQRRLSMLELLTTFNVYSYLQKFNAWKLSIIRLCDLEKKNMLHPLSTSSFICLVPVPAPFPGSEFRIPAFPYAHLETMGSKGGNSSTTGSGGGSTRGSF